MASKDAFERTVRFLWNETRRSLKAWEAGDGVVAAAETLSYARTLSVLTERPIEEVLEVARRPLHLVGKSCAS